MNRTSLQTAVPGSGLLHFLRVFVAVFMSGLATTMIVASLSGDPGNHPLHNAALPLFILFFFGLPIALGFSLLLAIGFFLVDRQALRAKTTFARHLPFLLALPILLFLNWGLVTSVELLSATKPENSLRSLVHYGGVIALFLALYWLLAGRVAGRPGWSIRYFRATPWDEKLFLLGLIWLLAPAAWGNLTLAAQAVLPLRPGTPEFHTRLPRQMSAEVKRALRRFPDSQSCLASGADATNRQDLLRMNWDAIRTHGDAMICTFRLLHDWGGAEDAAQWLEAQKFTVSPSHSSEHPYVERDGTLRVSGHWSIKENGPRYPTTGFLRRAFASIPYNMIVGATFSTDGKVLPFVDFSSSTL